MPDGFVPAAWREKPPPRRIPSPGMVHMRIVVASAKSERVMDLLEATPSASSLARLEGAARKP